MRSREWLNSFNIEYVNDFIPNLFTDDEQFKIMGESVNNYPTFY